MEKSMRWMHGRKSRPLTAVMRRRLATMLDSNELVESGDLLKIEELVGKCVLPSERKTISHQNSLSHSVQTDQCNGSLTIQDSVCQASIRPFQTSILPSDGISTSTCWNGTDASGENNVSTSLNSSTVGMNTAMVRSPILQVTNWLSSDKAIHTPPRKDVVHSHQPIYHSENHNQTLVCQLPPVSEGNIQGLVSKEGSAVHKLGSNGLKRKRRAKRNHSIPEFTDISYNNTDRKVSGASSDSPTVLDNTEVTSHCRTVKRIVVPDDTMVVYIPQVGSDVESEPELVICLSPESRIPDDDYEVVLDITSSSENSKRILSKGASLQLQMKIPALHSNSLHKNKGEVSDPVEDRTPQSTNESPGQIDEMQNDRNSLGNQIAPLQSPNVNPNQQVNNCEQIADWVLPSGFRSSSSKIVKEKLVECIKAHDISASFNGCPPNGGRKTRQGFERLPVHLDRPPNVKEKPAGSHSTRLSPHTVCSNEKPKNLMESDPTLRFVCPSVWLGGRNGMDSAPIMKTVFTTHSNQLVDFDEVIDNFSFAIPVCNSTQVSGQLVESTIGAVKGQNVASDSSQLKSSLQLDNSEPVVNCAVSLGHGELHESNSHQTVSGVVIAAGGVQTVRCILPSNIEEKSAISVSPVPQLSPLAVCDNIKLKNQGSESTVRFVCPSDWLSSREGNNSVPSVKPVRPVTELTNVNGKLVESPIGLVKGQNVTNEPSRKKRPHQQDDPEPVVKCVSPLDEEQLHETSFSTDEANKTNSSSINRISENPVSSKHPKNHLVTNEGEHNTPTSLHSTSTRISPHEISLNSQFENRLDNSMTTVTPNISDSEVIPEHLGPEMKCRLPCETQNEDDVLPHVEGCETIAYAMDLRLKRSTLLKSHLIDSIAVDHVNEIIGNLVCKQFLLDNLCTNYHCTLAHNVQLNFDLPGRDFKTSFNVFFKWYLCNSKPPHLKMLLQLLSHLSRDFGDDLLVTILCFSSALLKVAQNFRRPLGIKLVEKLVHLVDFTKQNAIRTIIIFNLSHDTEEAIITDLLHSLGAYEDGMTNLYESVSCIWHINENYSFSPNVLFAMLKECLLEMPPEFKVVKDKIIEELLKSPRSVLRKNYHVIERILLKYYALNSSAAHKVKCIVYYGKIPEAEDNSIQKKSYQSSRVQSTGPINPNWEYLDLNEERQKSFELVMGKMRQDETEEVCPPVQLSTAPGFNVEELLDASDAGDNLKLLTTLSNDSTADTSNCVRRMQTKLKRGKYNHLCHIFMSNAVRKSLDTYMNEFYNMLTKLDDKSELPRIIYECLKLMPRSKSRKTSLLVTNKFTEVISSLVLMFYKNRDFKNALKLLKTLRMSGVNPLGFPPNEVDEKTFTVVCSDIHFECQSMREAVQILLYRDCLNYVRYNCTPMLSNHFRLLERIVIKMLKCFVTKRLPSLALILFRAILLAQKDLFFPIDIGRFYELVICNSFITCKASCAPHDGANLYILVQRSCRHEVVLRPTTFRSLVVELVRVKAPDDIIRRTLQLCLHFEVYPAFTMNSITLGTHLLVEEMYIYLLHCFQYLLAQDRPAFLQRPCTVKLVQSSKPSRIPCPFLEDLKKVSTEISDATERFEEALRRLVGEVYPDLFINFISPSVLVIPTVGVRALAESLSENRK